jgi:hypothetical protein
MTTIDEPSRPPRNDQSSPGLPADLAGPVTVALAKPAEQLPGRRVCVRAEVGRLPCQMLGGSRTVRGGTLLACARGPARPTMRRRVVDLRGGNLREQG